MRTCEKVCKECPFSDTSLRGWLGPHSVEEIQDAIQGEAPFTCHLHRDGNVTDERILSGEVPICRGFMLSAEKSCKMFGQHNSLISKGLRDLQNSMVVTKKELVSILNKWKFKEHHTL